MLHLTYLCDGCESVLEKVARRTSAARLLLNCATTRQYNKYQTQIAYTQGCQTRQTFLPGWAAGGPGGCRSRRPCAQSSRRARQPARGTSAARIRRSAAHTRPAAAAAAAWTAWSSATTARSRCRRASCCWSSCGRPSESRTRASRPSCRRCRRCCRRRSRTSATRHPGCCRATRTRRKAARRGGAPTLGCAIPTRTRRRTSSRPPAASTTCRRTAPGAEQKGVSRGSIQ